MGKLKLLLFLCFSVFIFCANAQNEPLFSLNLENVIPGNFAKFYVDNLGNFYVLNIQRNQIKQLNSKGDSLQIFNNVSRYGNIYSIDVSNPLKILVYFKDFSTIVVLDHFFNPINTIDLRQSDILQAKAIAASYDNNIWVYDEQAGQIKKIDGLGNVIFASNDLRTVFSDAPDPSRIIDRNGSLYLYDKNLGWLQFDYYGALKHQLAYKNWEDVSVVNNILFGREGKKLWIYNPDKFDAQSFAMPLKIDLSGIKQMLWQGNKMYILNSNGISVYTVSQ